MLIQVVYPDDRYDYVKEFILDALIEQGKIRRFRRSSGWVTLGMDPVRTMKRAYTYRMPSEARKMSL